MPASEKKFFVNPAERPLPEQAAQPSGSTSIDAGSLAEATGLPAETLATYLPRRGRFLGQVISADLGLAGKPSADLYLRAITLSGYDQKQCIAFEDTEIGERAAHGSP